MNGDALSQTPLHLLETVRCLECGDVYAKPVAGGTADQNPGCPTCGYVGWLPVSVPSVPRHPGAGRLRRLLAQSR